MKIVMTGATSFTGMWIVKRLAERGHTLWTIIQKSPTEYEGTRNERLHIVENLSTSLFSLPFGSEPFFEALEKLPPFDLFCHHAADVTNYKSPDFDAVAALEKNTKELPRLLKLLKDKGCGTVLLTGSVFEPGEGRGSDNLRAVSPYGLSKGMTSQYFSYYCEREGVRLKKFVIPNPFGPYEEIRFTSFLARTWLDEKVAPVTHPDYVRDNIPVTLLASAYEDFATSDLLWLNPSYFVESQGEFTKRFQTEMKTRIPFPCEFELKIQTDFSEPLVRYNTDLLEAEKLSWDEDAFWDELASYYMRVYG